MATALPITNAGFDGGHYNFNNIGELQVPNGWSPWWLQGTPEQVADGYFKRPEFRAEPNRVRSGTRGQKWFTTYATHDAGLYQRVAIAASVTRVRLSAWVQYWSQHDDGSGGGLACQVGIHIQGGTDPFSPDVVWGEWHGQDDPDGWKGDTWREVWVEANPAPQATFVTLFLRSACRYRAKHNDSYWEDVTLRDITSGHEPPPGPEPDPDPELKTLAQMIRKLAADAATMEGYLRDAADRLEAMEALMKL